MEDLYALDFDGVLCDSCGESSLSAVKAAKVRWPGLFDGVDSATEDWIVDQMYTVRPVVETGYENVLLVRLLLEMRVPSIRKSSVAEGLTVEGILENWSMLKPVIMEEWGEKRDALVDLFGKVRDEWMDTDLATWIGANRFYPGVPEALKFASSRIYIVTTKQSRFADALLRELAGVSIPPERIYGLGTGPKVEVLKQLQKRPEHQGLRLHFVEDRLATLKNVIKEPELDGWNLYLGDWGYNTQKEREEAASISRIHLLRLFDFNNEKPINRVIESFANEGPEIWEDTIGQVDIFVMGIGSGGTVTGVGQYLKSKNPNVKIYGVEPAESNILNDGKPSPHLVTGNGVGFKPDLLDMDLMEKVLEVRSEDAVKMARELALKEGLMVGISSGANTVAALRLARMPENKGKLIVTVHASFGERTCHPSCLRS